jgi:hypothetical protein
MTTTIDGNSGVIFPNSTTQASAGQVLQVVYGTYGTQVASLSASYVDTGLSLSITPKFATSKIYISVCQSVYIYDDSSPVESASGLKIVRNSTDVFNQTANKDTSYIYMPNGGTRFDFNSIITLQYLDSPATTSSTTYKVQGALGTGRNMFFQNGNSLSSITLMEIAA